MALSINNGRISFTNAPFPHQLSVEIWQGGGWVSLPWQHTKNRLVADNAEGVGVEMQLNIAASGIVDYECSFRAPSLTRIRLALHLPTARNVFHLIPGVIHGDNGLPHAEPGHLPNLTRQHPTNISCSPYWELRADRASHPVSIVCFEGGIAGISVVPFSDCAPSNCNSDETFIRNGLFAQLADGTTSHGCGVTCGYQNAPLTFLNKDQWLPSTEHRSLGATFSGQIFAQQATDRRAAHTIVDAVYKRFRDVPAPGMTASTACDALVDAFLTVNWQDDYQNFSNMSCRDAYKKELTPWRPLAEIGWSGGAAIGYPLLTAGHALTNNLAIQRGIERLDWVARAANPKSGLLWDVCGEREGKQVDWWWSGYLVSGVHCAYTNGTALSWMLRAYEFCRDSLNKDCAGWLQTACGALDTVVALQNDDGGLGYTYHTERAEVVEAKGYAGAWFIPALTYAYRNTGRRDYLDAAVRGIEHYYQPVADLYAWGTPMDTFNAVDQEGNLALIRGAALLHRTTEDSRYLEILEDAANYEYLWRYGFRARPQYAPLKNSPWNSCGGSITSVSNPHIHPMGIYVSAELRYLADCTNSATHRHRYDDGINWAMNTIGLYPDISGYGRLGVVTERFCPSDGLTIETFPDGGRSSMWFSYNGWAAAAFLEGLTDHLQAQ